MKIVEIVDCGPLEGTGNGAIPIRAQGQATLTIIVKFLVSPNSGPQNPSIQPQSPVVRPLTHSSRLESPHWY